MSVTRSQVLCVFLTTVSPMPRMPISKITDEFSIDNCGIHEWIEFWVKKTHLKIISKLWLHLILLHRDWCECERKDVEKAVQWVNKPHHKLSTPLGPTGNWFNTHTSVVLNPACNLCIYVTCLLLSVKWAYWCSARGILSGFLWGTRIHIPGFPSETCKASRLCLPQLSFPRAPGSLSLPKASWAFPLGKHIKGEAGLLQADELPTPAWPHQQSSRPRVGGGCLLSNTTLSAHIFGRKLFLRFLERGLTHTHTHTDPIK